MGLAFQEWHDQFRPAASTKARRVELEDERTFKTYRQSENILLSVFTLLESLDIL